MAIVGGALVPVIQGYFADTIGLLSSFFVPALCYAYIVFYGLKGHVVRSGGHADISANSSADGARANM
jgi:fucose permease